jgi:NitT/TauT family transport system substrate-binding protein
MLETTMRLNPLAAVLVAGSLVLAACGGSGSKEKGGAAGPAVSPPTAAVAGCGPKAATPLSQIWPREIARCDPGTPAPRKLAEKTKVTVAIASKTADLAMALVWAAASGEFAKENLDVEIKVMPSSSTLSLLANGKLDATWSSQSAFFFNAVNDDFDIRWVLGANFPPQNAKEGLWVRNDRVKRIQDLKGKTIASLVGPGSSVSYIIDNELRKVGLSIKDVTLKQFDAGSLVLALKQGAVDAAFLQSPAWFQIKDDPAYRHIGGLWTGESLIGPVYGPSLLRENPEAGLAFVRAVIRTYSTYFTGDYMSDDAFVQKLAQAMGTKPEALKQAAPLVWDWEIRDRTVAGLQKTFQDAGAVRYREPIPDSRYVDSSFYKAAVGTGAQR